MEKFMHPRIQGLGKSEIGQEDEGWLIRQNTGWDFIDQVLTTFF